MGELFGWMLVAAWLLVPVAGVVMVIRWSMSARPVETKYDGSGAGLVDGFDAVFNPEAYEAHIERDRATKRTAPAPSPGDPPWAIDGDHIRIDV
ncbi:hypothetical protein Q9R19_06890 [Microbacterium sp. ARD32]|uniref:hypothetical protein n=1 Tax=Microbacterium sp. ARD32 TaxID=2962577 RepID=UPI002881C444|nr:hypothetical protein [Microbacterium sp. ARD32]MDT0157344.1 hypothetical protein [Microbacterium sp. ARD32]